MVPNPGGVITDPETGQRTNDVQQWNIRNVTTVTGTTYGGERTLTDRVSTGFTPNRTDTVPEYWSTYNKRVDFGQNFTDLFPTDAIKATPLIRLMNWMLRMDCRYFWSNTNFRPDAD